MAVNYVRREEQIRLIMECRQSGLSDYQWCMANNISPGNFYNWVSKLKKSGYTIPDSENRKLAVPDKQEVVKVDLAEPLSSASEKMEQNTHTLSASIAAEILLGNSTLRLYNDADKAVVQSILQCTGGNRHDW